jgi:hypothetical protein
MQSKATTVKEYLANLPEDRRPAIEAVRKVILDNKGKNIDEGMQYGMIGYCVPHRVYPAGYHCDPKQPLPFAGLASQKNHMSLYLGCVYVGGEGEGWFREEWAKTGKKLDMGKSCIRFKKIEDLALDVIARTIKLVTADEYIKRYESALNAPRKTRKPASKTALNKSNAKKKTKSSHGRVAANR